MQSSRIIQSSKRLLFAAPFLAILVPLFFTLSIRSQPSLVSPSGDSPLITYVHECMTPGFWMNMIGEGTFYGHLLSSPKYQIGVLLIFQSLACVVITLLLLWSTLYCKKSYLAPFTVAYALMSGAHFLSHYGRQHHHPGSRAILRSHALGLLSAGGGRPRLVPRLSGRRGMLFCQPCAQPQGEIIQVTGIIIFILYRHCC